MNITHIEHVIYAFLMQSVTAIVIGDWWIGAAFAIGWFVSREHAQREYKLFTFGEKNRLNPWQGFTGWSCDAIGDAAWPSVAVLLVAMYLG